MRKPVLAVFACALALGMIPFVPADISPIGSAYAKGGGGHGGGHSGGMGGNSGNGKSAGSDHAGKATRDHGVSGNHYGSSRNTDNGHGTTTSGIAHSKDTRGLAKSTAISRTTPGDHNSRGLSNAVRSSSKNDR
ncbi:hypothetical protein [Pseudomonas putida]|uniref:Glycine-rich protein n=1 Tax=Pseudomonas putida TaxID=303 RepID=A0AAD0L8H4_PSEPU|nr:hypothetical protein [Pseudomonas putida]AXA25739.1 hypothetical protein C1S65_17050 [Pseudomonas putida]